MMFSKQRLTLLLALLFAVGMSAEPIIHAHELDDDHHHEHVECQVCEVETLKFNDLALPITVPAGVPGVVVTVSLSSITSYMVGA